VLKKQKILIADDTWLNREILSEMLQDSYEIIEAENGLRAIEILEKQAYDISLLLLDIVMPEVDGFEVLAHMKRSQWIEDVPVIVISSETDASFIKKSYDYGAVDFISRPFDVDIVQRRVRNTIALFAKQRRLAAIVEDQIREKTRSSNLMVSILSHIVEFRNGESGQHVVNIGLLTELLLKRLLEKTDRYGLKKDQIALISTASSLHDIGKIAIPDSILNKPGRLTPEEFAIMKTHSIEGGQMLDRLTAYRSDPLVQTAYEICRWHHERYDGRGYPDGLIGDEIPISAQIVSLADVYDALTSERCYKKAFTHEVAIQMILDGQCGTFNPLLLECLLDIQDEVQAELRADPDEIKAQREKQGISEAIDSYGELTASSQLISQLEFEQGRVQFLEEELRQITFSYRNGGRFFSISKSGADLLGIGESIVDPLNNKAFLDCFGVDPEIFTDRGKSCTPENPDFSITGTIKAGQQIRPCTYRCRSIWSSAGKSEYLGSVGEIIFQ